MREAYRSVHENPGKGKKRRSPFDFAQVIGADEH
jgi:hypothetical protein